MSGHEPTVLAGGGRAWAECACGWLGRTWRTARSASVEWAAHLLERLSR